MPRDERPSDAVIEGQFRQANQALEDAVGAKHAELSETLIVNRLYYACFHAAQAILYDRGYTPTTHGGVLSLFGSEVVAADDATRADGRFLNKLGELRQQADYGYRTIDEDISTLLSRTRTFVAAMDSLYTTP